MNEEWNFWSNDWTKKVKVFCDGTAIRRPGFQAAITKILGTQDWGYERSISNEPFEYMVKVTGNQNELLVLENQATGEIIDI